MKYHPYVSGRRGSKRIPDVFQKEVVENPGVMVYLTCAVTGLGGRGGNKQVLKRHQSASLCTVTSDITSLVKAHLSYRGLHGGKLISVSVA